MNEEKHIIFIGQLQKIANLLALFAALSGILILMGWQFSISFLKSPLDDLPPINPASAFCFLLSGFAFLLLSSENYQRHKAGKGLAIVVIGIALYRLFDLLNPLPVHIDKILFSSRLNGTTNRMAVNTAVNFLVTGLALLSMAVPKRAGAAFQYLALFLVISCLISITGYLYQVGEFRISNGYHPVTANTSLLFLLLAGALLMAHPGYGWVQVLTSRFSGGLLSRRMIGMAVATTIILGYIVLMGARLGQYSVELAFCLLVSGIVIILGVFIFFLARASNQRDTVRQAAVKEKQDSQELFSALFYKTSTMNAIMELSTGRYMDLNDSYASFLGYSRDEVLGHTAAELGVIADGAQRQRFLEQVANNGFIKDAVMPVKMKNGDERWVSASADQFLIHGKSGILLSIIDITLVKKAEEKFRALLDSAPDAIVIVDEKGIIQLVNMQTEKLFGYTAAEMIGSRVEMLLPSRFVGGHESHRNQFFTSPKVRQMGDGRELFGRKKEGFEFPVEISLSPIRTEEGMLVSAAIRDITDKKQMELQIREVNAILEKKVKARTEELERKNKDLEQFAYVASHDLQEPLRTNSSFVEMFKTRYEGKLDVEADTMLGYMQQSSERMKTLIKDLLDYSRIGRKTEITVSDCNVLLQEVIADLSTTITENDAQVTVAELPVIPCYPTELKLLFQNLISNSIKFRRPGVQPVINIHATHKSGYWEFAVADNGIGIEEKYADRIFVIFQRLHTRSEYEGSGIGLAQCKKIAEMHGGTISVQSTPGSGSTFIFTIHEL